MLRMNKVQIGGMAKDSIGKVRHKEGKAAGRMAQKAKGLDQEFFGWTRNAVGDIEDVTTGARKRNEWHRRRLLTDGLHTEHDVIPSPLPFAAAAGAAWRRAPRLEAPVKSAAADNASIPCSRRTMC